LTNRIVHFVFPVRQHQACARLDDWIAHCVGVADAEKLAASGITTIERLPTRPLLLDVLTSLGFYFDQDSMAIRKY